MPLVGTVNGNLCFLRLARAWRWDNFLDGSWHGGTGVFWNSRRIEFQFRYSCGSGHSRLGHFLINARMRRVAGLFPKFPMRHTSTLTPR